MDKPKYKWCFFPYCGNNSKNTPNKIFLSVPTDEDRKVRWFQAIKQNTPTTKTKYYCCEDHFNLEEDAENYVQFKLMGGRISLKRDVVPHTFQWPRGYKRSLDTPDFPKDKHQKVLHLPTPSTSAALDVHDDPIGTSVQYRTKIPKYDLPVSNIGSQVKPHVRSKYVSCHISPNTTSTASSPIKCLKKLPKKLSFTALQSSSEEEKETSEFLPSSSGPTDIEIKECAKEDKKEAQTLSLNVTMKLIENNPKRYLGVPKKYYYILLNLLCKHGKLKKENVLLCLMKIKTNDTFARLGDQFGISCSAASKIFKGNLLTIGHLLKPLVYWPGEELIKKNLPIPFRARYSSVQSIIDCLEIQIEKPSNPMRQALTWSEYKKCNTFKYLISCTPDGFINFVSSGFGGRISDVLLLEQCNYVNILPRESAVMADRGFKRVDNILKEKNCTLIKPPSVSSSTKLTKSEVIETKRIASLRIHVERLIRRIREFTFLKPHSVINHQMLSYTDTIIYIACALINLQSPIIRNI